MTGSQSCQVFVETLLRENSGVGKRFHDALCTWVLTSVMFQSPVNMRSQQLPLVKLMSSDIFQMVITFCQSVCHVHRTKTHRSASQSVPQLRPTFASCILQSTGSTWFRVAVLVPPDVPLVELSDCLAVAALPRNPVCFHSLSNLLMLLAPRGCPARDTVWKRPTSELRRNPSVCRELC